MSVTIHRAESTRVLVGALGDLLADPLDDPFAEEVVVVPAKGVERWLTQRLSHRLGVESTGSDGVCAGVRFLSPHSLVALLLGIDDTDPWQPDRLVWPVLAVIDAHLGEPWAAPLARHLGHDREGAERTLRQDRRYAVAHRLAQLFASYAVQRPDLLRGWREGRDDDGLGSPLAADLAWQPELWRRVLDQVPADPPDVRLARTLAALRDPTAALRDPTAAGEPGADEPDLDLPARLSLFGHTRLPRSELLLLDALGTRRDVHLWLPQTSAVTWDALRETAAEGPVPRRDDRSAELVHHPLLASLGRDAREVQRSLALIAGARDEVHPDRDPPRREGRLLGWLQDDLRHDQAPDDDVRDQRPVAAHDRSVQVHACHSPGRQVDVLREVLAGLLADDPTLEPRDILVMCPDIETYAPLIQAGFGLGDVEALTGRPGHPAHHLRVLLADRALTSTNPLLDLAATLVELAGARVTATQVLDLVAQPVVARRFGFDDKGLATISRWVQEAAIRWGVDEADRAAYSIAWPQNTWRFGLDRLLAGVAMAEVDDHAFDVALPVDDVPSGAIDLAGRFAELVDRLATAREGLAGARTATEWADAIGAGARMLGQVPDDHAWQEVQLDRELAQIADNQIADGQTADGQTADGQTAQQTPAGTPLSLADVRALLEHRLAGRPTRANFRVGTLTVCTMVPMRSVPHRVVCLLGVDDGVFPRRTTVDGDDVLARTPVTGERDPRSEDRQLLLDAVMAATETLVVTYTGANELTGKVRPPAVPLGELIDAVSATATHTRPVVTRHPLQPFDPRSFGLDDPLTLHRVDGTAEAFSFDAAGLAGARAATTERHPPVALTERLPALPGADVSLADLHRFFRNPAMAFLRDRLDVSTPLEADETDDAVPITLDALEKWAVGDRMLRRLLDGMPAERVFTAELTSGNVPPGPIGYEALEKITTDVQTLYAETASLRAQPSRSVEVDVVLDEVTGRRLTGTVTNVFGTGVLRVAYSRLGAAHRLASWIDLLALTAAHPDGQWTGHAWGRAPSRQRLSAQEARTGPLDPRLARELLGRLVQIRDLGLRFPAPLPPKTSLAMASAAVRIAAGESLDPYVDARRAWETDRDSAYGVAGENDSAASRRVYGASAPLEVLLGEATVDEEGWNDQRTLLGRYAWEVWERLLTGAEQLRSR